MKTLAQAEADQAYIDDLNRRLAQAQQTNAQLREQLKARTDRKDELEQLRKALRQKDLDLADRGRRISALHAQHAAAVVAEHEWRQYAWTLEERLRKRGAWECWE